MTWFDRTPLARTLAAYLVTTAIRSLGVALLALAGLLVGLLLSVGPAEVAAVVDWRLLVRVLVLLGRVAVRTPTGLPAA